MTREEVVRVVVDEAERDYRLTDEECGLSLVRDDDVFECDRGLFKVSFRIDSGYTRRVEWWADAVCGRIGCDRHLFVYEGREWGIPYLEVMLVFEA